MNNSHLSKFLLSGTSLLFTFLLAVSLPSQERTVVDFDSPIRWIIPNEGSNLEDEWKDTGFDDSDWNEGSFAIGYNAGGMIRTEVPDGTTVIFCS